MVCKKPKKTGMVESNSNGREYSVLKSKSIKNTLSPKTEFFVDTKTVTENFMKGLEGKIFAIK